MKTTFGLILLILALELAFCAWLGRGSVPPLPFEGDIPTITPPPLPFSDLAIPHAQPLSVIALPEPHAYLRQPAVVHPVLGFMPISWAPDTNAALYEVWSAPELCGPWNLVIRTQGTNASVTNHLTQEFFQVVSVTADGFNSFGNYQ